MVKLEAKLHDTFPFLKDKIMKDARVMVKRERECVCVWVCSCVRVRQWSGKAAKTWKEAVAGDLLRLLLLLR